MPVSHSMSRTTSAPAEMLTSAGTHRGSGVAIDTLIV
jgi:hypothetical protein